MCADVQEDEEGLAWIREHLLLDVYNAAAVGDGIPPLTELDVRFHEIALHLRWYREDRAGVPSAGGGGVLARLRNLVKLVRP